MEKLISMCLLYDFSFKCSQCIVYSCQNGKFDGVPSPATIRSSSPHNYVLLDLVGLFVVFEVTLYI